MPSQQATEIIDLTLDSDHQPEASDEREGLGPMDRGTTSGPTRMLLRRRTQGRNNNTGIRKRQSGGALPTTATRLGGQSIRFLNPSIAPPNKRGKQQENETDKRRLEKPDSLPEPDSTTTAICGCCLEGLRTVVLQPCNHFWLCQSCLEKPGMYDGKSPCPICRQVVTSFVLVRYP